MCCPVRSDIGLQLERLEIKNALHGIDSTVDVAKAVKTLPKLRKLTCPAHTPFQRDGPDPVNITTLEQILSAAPELRELVISDYTCYRSLPVRLLPYTMSES